MRDDLLTAAIIARVKADTGAGGLWGASGRLLTAVNYVIEGRTATGLQTETPYVTFSYPVREQVDGFSYDLLSYVVHFHVWDLVERQATGERPMAIVARLFGNASENANRTPDYGFHRWQGDLYQALPPPGAVWKMSLMHRVAGAEAHEDSVWHFIETYRVHLTRVVPTS